MKTTKPRSIIHLLHTLTLEQCTGWIFCPASERVSGARLLSIQVRIEVREEQNDTSTCRKKFLFFLSKRTNPIELVTLRSPSMNQNCSKNSSSRSQSPQTFGCYHCLLHCYLHCLLHHNLCRLSHLLPDLQFVDVFRYQLVHSNFHPHLLSSHLSFLLLLHHHCCCESWRALGRLEFVHGSGGWTTSSEREERERVSQQKSEKVRK